MMPSERMKRTMMAGGHWQRCCERGKVIEVVDRVRVVSGDYLLSGDQMQGHLSVIQSAKTTWECDQVADLLGPCRFLRRTLRMASSARQSSYVRLSARGTRTEAWI